MNWKLTLAYDGTDFHGWQIQPEHTTIQGELAGAIERITAERILPQGSGRTDAGVHARAQVASFELNAPIPPENLHRALNRTLPTAIRVLSAEHASPGFHARHSVQTKTYEYRIWRGEICPPWIAATDPDLFARTSDSLDSDAKAGNIRTIFSSSFSSEDEDVLIYQVRGNGFLHHMVRNLVGTFLDGGRGHIEPEDVRNILDQRSRSAAGGTAPARGLWLDSVEY
jgi:tRNA pseudouridine38-40 synthase